MRNLIEALYHYNIVSYQKDLLEPQCSLL